MDGLPRSHIDSVCVFVAGLPVMVGYAGGGLYGWQGLYSEGCIMDGWDYNAGCIMNREDHCVLSVYSGVVVHSFRYCDTMLCMCVLYSAEEWVGGVLLYILYCILVCDG